MNKNDQRREASRKVNFHIHCYIDFQLEYINKQTTESWVSYHTKKREIESILNILTDLDIYDYQECKSIKRYLKKGDKNGYRI